MPKLTPALILNLCILTLVYFAAGKLGLRLAYLHPSASAVWPPTGIAIASVLLLGFGVWPALYIGAFLVNLTTTGDIPSSLVIALGNTLEAIVAGYLVRRFAKGLHAFDKPETILRFAFFACGLSTMVSATIGVGSLLLFHFASPPEAMSVWITWWLGDAGGALVFAPIIILWYQNRVLSLSVRHIIKLFLLFGSSAVMAILVFSGIFPFAYLTIPPILWGAIGFGPRETATSIFLVSFIATYFTSRGQGPFTLESTTTNQSLILLQVFIGVIVVTKLIVASVVEEKKRSQTALANNERRFRALTEKSADATALVDNHAVIHYTSPSATHVIGYQPEELDGTSGLALVHPLDLDKAKKTLADILDSPNQTRTIELRLKHKDGSFVWVEMNGTNLIHDPAVKAIVVNYRDITERRQLEEAKNEFLRIAAHQLRTPLSTIRWNMELVQKTAANLPEGVGKKLTIVYEKVKHMVILINELLDVSAIIQGDTRDNPQKIDAGVVIENVVAQLTEEIKKKSLKVDILKPEGHIPQLWVDQKRFTIVIQNILSNAIKYNRFKGTVTIDVMSKDSRLFIYVTDTGIGIPPKDSGKIFTKFFRATNAMATDVEGTGLGLFLVKSYIEKWGGSIKFISPIQKKRGIGTQFVIALPLPKQTKLKA